MASQEDCYRKAPGLTYFLYSELEADIQRELEVCEVLRRHTHPNLTTYYGCREENGRATGICFKRYKETLSGKVNPRYLNKNRFRASGHEQVDHSLRENFYGILEGIKDLHSPGLVHNDINPSNIMLDEIGRHWRLAELDRRTVRKTHRTGLCQRRMILMPLKS